MPELTRRQWIIVAAVLGVVVLVVAGLALAGGGGDEETAPTTSTTAETTTTSTTAPSGPTYPLTGLPVEDPAAASSPVLAVKIDNAEPRRGQGGRPQAGINQADVVFEEMVEGSVTRLLALFHSDGSDPVGPVRSARTTDLLLMEALDRPLFAWSGANENVVGQVRAADIVDIGYDANPGVYYRDRDRPAPYNLFSSTQALRDAAGEQGERPPPALFSYREAGTEPAGGQPVTSVNVNFGDGPGSAPVDWEWDGSGWARSQRGDAHVDASGERVAPPNVVIRFTPYEEVQCCDASGFPIVEAQLVGSGDAWILTGGQLIEGRWEQTAIDEPATFTGSDGEPVELTPGRTWVAIAPPGAGTIR